MEDYPLLLERAETAVAQLSPADKYKPILPLLLPLDRQDRARLLKDIAANTKTGERHVNADFNELLEAGEAEMNEAAARATIKQQVREDLGVPPELEACAADRDYLAACVAVLAMGEDAPYGFEDIEAWAIKNGQQADYARDYAIAPDVQASRELIEGAGGGIAKKIEVTFTGAVAKWVGQKHKVPSLVSGPVIVAAIGDNGQSETPNPHVLLKIRRQDKTWVDFVLPMSDLQSGSWAVEAMKRDLMVLDHETLSLILKAVRASGARQPTFQTAERVGYQNASGVFVLPSGEVVSAENHHGYVVPVFERQSGWNVAGSREEADQMLRHCSGNTRLMLGIGTALAAPYVPHMGVENGAVHFYADTSQGKTTLLITAASMYGMGAEEKDGGIVRSWNSTLYAVAKVGALHNHLPWFLDELKLNSSARIVQPLIHTISKGVGKEAGGKNGELRSKQPFATLVLSTGECSVRRYQERDGRSYEGGEAVRIIDIPAVARYAEHYVFEKLPPGMSAPAFSDYLKETAREHYGHHGRDVLRHLVKNTEAAIELARQHVGELRYDLGERFGDEPDVGRVLDRLAFIGGVNEAHIAAGLIPFDKGEAANAAWSAARDWHAARGGDGEHQALSALDHFTEFVVTERGKFWDRTRSSDAPYEVVGFTRLREDGRREYWFTDGQLDRAIGQDQRQRAFLKYVSDGKSEDWELVADRSRFQRDVPQSWDHPSKRMYCFAQRRALAE